MPNILLVDDEAALVRVLREAIGLQLPGASVHTAGTWSEAMDAASALPSLDLLVVDHHLGQDTGIDLVLALRQRFGPFPTLLYTGKATADVETAALAVGARVLWKPQRLQRLLDEVRSALAGAPG